MKNKPALRKQALQARKAIVDRPQQSRKIFEALLALPLFQKAERIAAFASFGTEVDTLPILQYCLTHKQLFLPRVEGKQMRFYKVSSLESLQTSSIGILEPAPIQEENQFDLVLVPGLAFDEHFHRLGYGGGYYDAYFTNNSASLLALCFNEQIWHAIPHEAHDIAMHYILTPQRFLGAAYGTQTS